MSRNPIYTLSIGILCGCINLVNAEGVKDLECIYHPKDPKTGFCTANMMSNIPPTVNLSEYTLVNGKLKLYSSEKHSMARANGVLFSNNGKYLLHSYNETSHVYGAFYKTDTFLKGQKSHLADFSEHNIIEILDFTDNGLFKLVVDCPNKPDHECVKTINILNESPLVH